MNIKSDGLIGEAKTRTNTSPGPGRGTGISTTAMLSGLPSYARSCTARMKRGIAIIECAQLEPLVDPEQTPFSTPGSAG